MTGAYEGRPPTVFFEYHECCEYPARDRTRVTRMSPEENEKKPMLFRISEKTWTYNCVLNPLKIAGFTETKESDYNLFWMGSADNKLLN